ncbi:MAG: hypothetical protein H0X62_02020 [Bacteroidetes bacterium]|nr:hypothetical protein [Bacteroidota bacterium]
MGKQLTIYDIIWEIESEKMKAGIKLAHLKIDCMALNIERLSKHLGTLRREPYQDSFNKRINARAK